MLNEFKFQIQNTQKKIANFCLQKLQKKKKKMMKKKKGRWTDGDSSRHGRCVSVNVACQRDSKYLRKMIIPDVVVTGGRRWIPDGTVAQKPIAPHLDGTMRNQQNKT